jgi:DeoR/GlpR family transcriptional regulator of sugar metabolism
MLDYAAFPEQRQDLIRQILQQNGRVVCTELAAQMKVSEHTIRRDLHELSKEGICKKVYGGAVLQLADAGTFLSREQQNHAKKDMIAQKAATLIKAGSCIFMDTGTTNLALAKALPAELALTVVTNSPAIAAELLRHPLCEVIITGGQIQRTSGGTVGSTAAGSSAMISSVSPVCMPRTVLRTIITGSGQRRPWASRVWSGVENRSVILVSFT